jgi:hypothetical protein
MNTFSFSPAEKSGTPLPFRPLSKLAVSHYPPPISYSGRNMSLRQKLSHLKFVACSVVVEMPPPPPPLPKEHNMKEQLAIRQNMMLEREIGGRFIPLVSGGREAEEFG